MDIKNYKKYIKYKKKYINISGGENMNPRTLFGHMMIDLLNNEEKKFLHKDNLKVKLDFLYPGSTMGENLDEDNIIIIMMRDYATKELLNDFLKDYNDKTDKDKVKVKEKYSKEINKIYTFFRELSDYRFVYMQEFDLPKYLKLFLNPAEIKLHEDYLKKKDHTKEDPVKHNHEKTKFEHIKKMLEIATKEHSENKKDNERPGLNSNNKHDRVIKPHKIKELLQNYRDTELYKKDFTDLPFNLSASIGKAAASIGNAAASFFKPKKK